MEVRPQCIHDHVSTMASPLLSHDLERHLGEPETTECFIAPVARGPLFLVVLQKSGEEEERGDGGVDQTLVNDVEVGDTLSHRTVKGDDDDDEDVG